LEDNKIIFKISIILLENLRQNWHWLELFHKFIFLLFYVKAPHYSYIKLVFKNVIIIVFYFLKNYFYINILKQFNNIIFFFKFYPITSRKDLPSNRKIMACRARLIGNQPDLWQREKNNDIEFNGAKSMGKSWHATTYQFKSRHPLPWFLF